MARRLRTLWEVIEMKRVYFTTGIDTDIGKTVAVGLAARYLMRKGVSVITQKLVQTGVDGDISEDVAVHRRLMGISLTEDDLEGTTCPLIFKFPASPHLAAERERRVVDVDLIDRATEKLLTQYDIILLEGAGGWHVPLTRDLLTSDYIAARRYPTILVTSGRLGSVNHTLLTLESIRNNNVPLAGLVYNNYHEMNEIIRRDTLALFRDWLAQHTSRPRAIEEMPIVSKTDFLYSILDVNFSQIFDL
ncbi:MAG: dethiobiotin synthase [Planctomycetaceae bacterium]|jgi:dethiobiotin synthetase|nr:dethiobiotin synthase [Planctomycetaceae bacterium]